MLANKKIYDASQAYQDFEENNKDLAQKLDELSKNTQAEKNCPNGTQPDF